MVYRWREGSRPQHTAQPVGERLESIRNSHGGTLTPRLVVADAVDEASPLHEHFEWNDATAAQEHRIQQARELIAEVLVVFADDVEGAPKEPMRAFVSISAGGSAPAYASTLEAVQSPELRAIVLATARKELEGWRLRYMHYAELAMAVERVEQALDAAP